MTLMNDVSHYLWAFYSRGLTNEPTNRLDVERCAHLSLARHTF
jgi:hypothetical protein